MHKPRLNAEEVSDYVHTVFSEADRYNWSVEEVSDGAISVKIITSKSDTRPGGTVSGPTMFALADLAAYLLILSHIGKVGLAVTTNLNINFLNKPEPGTLYAEGKLLKLGKRLAVCEISIFSADKADLVAHATATYSIPPKK